MMDALTGALKSKTMWVNGLSLVGVVLDQVVNGGVLTTSPVTLAVITAINMILRAVTTKALADK